MPRRRIGEDRLVGLEHPFQAGKAFFGNLFEPRAGEIDRAAIHGPQNAVGDIGWSGILIKVVSATERHPLHSLVFYLTAIPAVRPSRVRPTCKGHWAVKKQRGRLKACLFSGETSLPTRRSIPP